MFFFGFFGRPKILKSEQDFNYIRKFPKQHLTINFAENIDTYSKGHSQIQKISYQFKGTVTIFGYFMVKNT